MDKQKKRESLILEIMNKITLYSSEGESYQPEKLLKYLKLIRQQQSSASKGYIETKLRQVGGIQSLITLFNRILQIKHFSNNNQNKATSSSTTSELQGKSKKRKNTKQSQINTCEESNGRPAVNIELYTNGLSILGNAFAVDSKSRLDAEKMNFIVTLQHFLESSTFSSNSDIVARVLKCLANLAVDNKLRSSILQKGIAIGIIHKLDEIYNKLVSSIEVGENAKINELISHKQQQQQVPQFPQQHSTPLITDIVKIEEIIVEKNEENIVCQAVRCIRIFSSDIEFQEHLIRFGALLSIGRFLKFSHNEVLFSDILKALAILTTTTVKRKFRREIYEKFETLTDEDSPERFIMLKIIKIVKSYNDVKCLAEPALICLTQLASNANIAKFLVTYNIFEACLIAVEKTDDIPRLDKILRLLMALTQETAATQDFFSHHLRLSCCPQIGQTLKILRISELKNYHHWILKLYENLSEDKLKDLVNRGIIDILDEYLRAKLGDYNFESLSKKLSNRDDDKCFVHTTKDSTCPFSPKFRCSSPTYTVQVQLSEDDKSCLEEAELPSVLHTLKLNNSVLLSPCTSPYESPNDSSGERYSSFSPTYSPVMSPLRQLSFSPTHSSGHESSNSYSDDDEGVYSGSSGGTINSSVCSPSPNSNKNSSSSNYPCDCEYSEDEPEGDPQVLDVKSNATIEHDKTIDKANGEIYGPPPKKKVKFQLAAAIPFHETKQQGENPIDPKIQNEVIKVEQENMEVETNDEANLALNSLESSSEHSQTSPPLPPSIDQIRTRYNKIVSILGIIKKVAHLSAIPTSLTKYLPFLLEIIWSTRMSVENLESNPPAWEQCNEFVSLARLCFQRAQSIVFRICSDINTFPCLVEDSVIPLMYRILSYNLRGRQDHPEDVKNKINDFIKQYSNKIMDSLVGIVNGNNESSGWREGYFLRKCCSTGQRNVNMVSDKTTINVFISIPLLYCTNFKIFRDFEERTQNWANIFELLTNVDDLSFSQFQNCILALTCIANAKRLKWSDAESASKRKLLYLSSNTNTNSNDNNKLSMETNQDPQPPGESLSSIVMFELDDGSTMSIQKEELTKASPYFTAMFDGHFLEAKSNRVHLPKTSRSALNALALQIREENQEKKYEEDKMEKKPSAAEQVKETVCDRIMHSYQLSTLFELLSLCDQFLLDNIYERTLNTLISFYICPHSVPIIYEESLKFQGFHRTYQSMPTDNQLSTSKNTNLTKLALKYLLVGEDICFTLRSGSFWKIFDSTIPSLVVQNLQEILQLK